MMLCKGREALFYGRCSRSNTCDNLRLFERVGLAAGIEAGEGVWRPLALLAVAAAMISGLRPVDGRMSKVSR